MSKRKSNYDFDLICARIERKKRNKERALRNYERQKAYKQAKD